MQVKNMLCAAVAASIALTISGCNDSIDSVVEDTMAEMKSATATLKGITDAASVKANESKLKAHGERFKALKARGEKFGSDDAVKKRLKEKYGNELETVGMEFGKEMMRVGMMGPEAQQALKGMLSEMD